MSHQLFRILRFRKIHPTRIRTAIHRTHSAQVLINAIKTKHDRSINAQNTPQHTTNAATAARAHAFSQHTRTHAQTHRGDSSLFGRPQYTYTHAQTSACNPLNMFIMNRSTNHVHMCAHLFESARALDSHTTIPICTSQPARPAGIARAFMRSPRRVLNLMAGARVPLR